MPYEHLQYFSLYKREVKIPSSFIVLFYYTIGTSQFYLILQIALWYVFLLTLSAAFGLALIRAQANRLAITLYHIVFSKAITIPKHLAFKQLELVWYMCLTEFV